MLSLSKQGAGFFNALLVHTPSFDLSSEVMAE